MKNIAIYGAGGYGQEAACLIKAINAIECQWNLIGFFDDTKPIGCEVAYGKILGGIHELNQWTEELSVVMAIGNPVALEKLTMQIVNPLIDFPNLIASDVCYHDRESVKMGKGNVIFFRSLVSCHVTMGNFNLLNNDVFVGHNSIIGSYNVMNPSVRVSGNVSIGNTNFLGVSSVVLQTLKIGNGIVLGAGSVLIRKPKDGNTYVGNPATVIKY